MEGLRIPGYEVGGPIGFGAGGAAHAVRDREGASRAAVVAPTGERAARLGELRNLHHPHLPQIHDLVAVEDRVVVVMDLVVGPSLATLVNARSWLTHGEVATVWHGVADALAALHHRDLVHGDVSPANVIIGPGGVPVLVDVVGHGGAERGHTGYVPPELDEGPATTASDVWSLARTLAWASGDDPAVVRHVGPALASDPRERPGARDFATWSFLLGPGDPVDVPPAADLAGAQLRSAAAPTIITAERRGVRGGRMRVPAIAVAVVAGFALLLGAGRALGSAMPAGEPARAVAIPAAPSPEEVHAAVGALLDERDAALATGDAAALAAVHTPGSPAAASDAALLAAVTAEGLRLEGYGTDVLAVELVAGSSRAFTARVEVRQRAHTRVGPDGTVRPVGPQDPHCVLVSAEGRGDWRIVDVTGCQDS